MENDNKVFVLKIRASAAGLLLPGGGGISAKQLERLSELKTRNNGRGKPLTSNMEAELADLITKRDMPPQLGQTGKSYVEKLWLKIKYGYDEPVVTEELIKGDMCEQEGMDIVSVLWPGEFRKKNDTFFQDDHFTGVPDTLLEKEDVVEDTKSAWTVKTFFGKTEVDPIYFAQGQVYMHLTGRKKFRVHYCLVNTPAELVHNEQKRFFWKYGGDENNQKFKKAAEQIARNHNVDHIPLAERVKTFEFEYDPTFIAELQSKVILARAYYNTIEL